MNTEAINYFLSAKEHLGYYNLNDNTIVFMFKDGEDDIRHIVNTVKDGKVHWEFMTDRNDITFYKY